MLRPALLACFHMLLLLSTACPLAAEGGRAVAHDWGCAAVKEPAQHSGAWRQADSKAACGLTPVTDRYAFKDRICC